MPRRLFLALDLGATSLRGVLGGWDGERLTAREVARWPNAPLPGPGGLVWPFAAIVESALEALARAANAQRAGPGELAGVACDAWAVDHGFLDATGRLLAPPHSYQDPERTRLGELALRRHLTPAALFAEAGSPYVAIATLHQWLATRERKPEWLADAARLLLIPELLAHALCGEAAGEFSSASTTALCAWRTRAWNGPLLDRLGLPAALLPPLREAGTSLGRLRPELARAHALPPVPLHLVAGHDTASAVIGSGGAPAGELVVSSGTWLMLALRVADPTPRPGMLEHVIGHYGLPGGGWMRVAGIMGLYLLERLRSEEGWPPIPELCAAARAAPPFACLLDPGDAALTGPGRLRELLARQAARHGQALPEETATLVRALLEALALYAAELAGRLESFGGPAIARLRIVGGGARNTLLNQLFANATGRPVIAGEPEAAARGNLALQLLAAGEVRTLEEACAVAAAGAPEQQFDPESGGWPARRAAFQALRAPRAPEPPPQGVSDARTVARA